MATGIQISPSSDITVGTTAISNGTEGRVLFQGSGNVVQQDSGLFWNNTNKKLTVANSFALNGSAGTGFTSMFSIFRGATEVFKVDEYKSQFTGSVYMNSIVGADMNAIIFGNQSGSGNLITMSPTQGRLAIGYNSATYNAALDVKAQGALSTDIAFRVRNSADTVSLFQQSGDGSYIFRNNSNTAFWNAPVSGGMEFFGGGQTCTLTTGSNANLINTGSSMAIGIASNRAIFFSNGNLQIEDTAIVQTSGKGGLSIKTGTNPTVSTVDRFNLYSADITAGNAAPHFRTENGSVVKLYQQTSTGTETVADVVQYLKNLGLLV
jgi:hypothetical protein